MCVRKKHAMFQGVRCIQSSSGAWRALRTIFYPVSCSLVALRRYDRHRSSEKLKLVHRMHGHTPVYEKSMRWCEAFGALSAILLEARTTNALFICIAAALQAWQLGTAQTCTQAHSRVAFHAFKIICPHAHVYTCMCTCICICICTCIWNKFDV